MWVNSLYSYPYLNQQKPLVLPIIAYTLSTTKLEIRAESFCQVVSGKGGKGGSGVGGKGGDGKMGGEVTQTLYAHMK
jgi:hypothetical protein